MNHMAAKIIENVCTTFSAQAQGFITGEIGPVYGTYSNIPQLILLG